MAELIRVIEEEDIPKLHNIMKKVFDDSDWLDIDRLGGMTNHSYKITRNDRQEYLVRIPGEGTEKMINRSDERISTELACKLGIDSPLIYFDDEGYKVMQFISNPRMMTEEVMRRKENINQAAVIFRKLHNCGVDTGVRFEVFEMAELYEDIIYQNDIRIYDDYTNIKNEVMRIKSYIDSNTSFDKVPCHNDSLIGNWVIDGKGKLYLVDWEYSGMNEAMWDLSCLSIEAEYSTEDDIELLNIYYDRESTIEERKRFIAAKLYVDFLWTLWGLTRIPYDGQFMKDYADQRYKRLKENINIYKAGT